MIITIILTMVIALGLANLLASIAQMVVSRPLAQRGQAAPHLALSPQADAPFVSVHLAIYNEPADMVIATLDALAKSSYPAFEVIVVDNNTADPAVWQPVARHVAHLGAGFRFLHADGVTGAKAGALNLALSLTDQRAAYVAVVDADYQVTPDFIAMAVAACGPHVQFVQFPQSYRCAAGAGAVVSELSDYFEIYPRAANRAHAALLTGTLSLISIPALRGVGGWPIRSITEDAELGLRLWRSGARGLYIAREAGCGLLPLDLAGLRLQRQRWVTGNVQTLIGGWRSVFSARSGCPAVLAQLSAWVGLLAVPLATLMLVALARAWPMLAQQAPPAVWQTAEGISIATFACALLGQAARAMARGHLGSLAVTSALLWTSSFGWLQAFAITRPTFRRTPKVGGQSRPALSVDTITSLVALGTALAFLWQGSPLTALVLALSAAGLVTAPIIDRSLRRASAESSPCQA